MVLYRYFKVSTAVLWRFRALKFSFGADILVVFGHLFQILGVRFYSIFGHTDRDISFQEVGSVRVVAPSFDELSRCRCYKTFYISNLQITVPS